MSLLQKGLSPEQYSVMLESTRESINKEKQRLRDTHLRRGIIKEEIVDLDEPFLEAIRETKPIDYENKLIKLNNTIDNLQSIINLLSFNQLPTIQSKEYKRESSFDSLIRIEEGITRTVSDPAITRQIEGAESQENLLSSPTKSVKKEKRIYYYFDSKLNTYKDMFQEYKHTKPSILINDYAKKMKNNKLAKDFVEKERRLWYNLHKQMQKKLGGYMKWVKKGSDRYNELARKKWYLVLNRDALNTMHSAIDKLSFSETGLLYVNIDQMIERLYIFLEQRKERNDSD